jgi:hypothetical protein
MATLAPPFDRLKPGAHALQASFLGWHNVGTCNITENSQYRFAANGTYNALGHSGTFDIVLALTDQNPNATTGPCDVTNGGQTISGTYTRSGDTISFADNAHTISASPDPSGVILQIQGYPKARIQS